MGVDIYTSSGILFTLEDAVDKFFKGITTVKIKKLIPEIESELEDDENKENLKAISNIADLKVWFIEFANVDTGSFIEYVLIFVLNRFD